MPNAKMNLKAVKFSMIFSLALIFAFVILYYFPLIGILILDVLTFVAFISIAIIFRHYFPRLTLDSKPQREILTEFMHITKQHVILSGYGDDSNIKSISAIGEQLRNEIDGDGWKRIRRKFTNAVRAVFGMQWYSENRFLLKVLGIEEYLGYEGSILDILKGIQSCSRIEELEQLVISQLIPGLQAQIQSGGNTTFLDVDKMKEGESVRLVPILLEKRREHFLTAMDKYRVSQRNMNDLSDVLTTNYGFNVAKAIKKEIGSPKAVGYIVTQLDSVYETLVQDRENESISPAFERTSTPWMQLSREAAMAHISRLIDVKFDIPFQYCNPNFSTLYESGYRDIFKELKEIQSYPKLYKGEYKFILEILKCIKTRRASRTYEILKQKEWKDKYLQS